MTRKSIMKAVLVLLNIASITVVQFAESSPIVSPSIGSPSSMPQPKPGDGPDMDMLRNYYMFKDRQYMDNNYSNEMRPPMHSYLLELQEKLKALQDQELDTENEMFKYGILNSEFDPNTDEKRAWKAMGSSWGKRVASNNDNWNKFRGSWGKRQEPNWNNLKGLWGKRSALK